MEKITRIHLAKIPYEIGIDAQDKLKKYLDEIHGELDPDLADDIMTDIEVRITEILSDRNVKRNDVITSKDIEAVEAQLGSPGQFTESETKDKQKSPSENETRKLLRDTDDAYIGGVASGLGAYFTIDPIVVRIVFILLTFISGLGILLYILLWLLVPAAKSNSDKLLMRGKPVTAAALQHYRSGAQRTLTNLRLRSVVGIVFKIFRVLFTTGVAIFVLALLASIGLASAILYTQPLHSLYVTYRLNYVLLSLIWLFTMTVVGLLIVLLLRLWRQRSYSLKVAFITLVSLLILTLAGGAVVSPFIVSHYKDQYSGNKLAVAITVHNDTPSVPATSLNVVADHNLIVSYVVTSQPLHATYQAYPGMGQPNISVTNKNGIVTMQANQLSQVVPSCVLDWCQHIYLPIRVTLYGPAMQKFSANGGAELDLDSLVQTQLDLAAQNNSNLNIDNSYSDNFSLSAESGASINASDTSAQVATITAQNGSYIFGPANSTLKVTLPQNCDNPILEFTQAPTLITLNSQSVTSQTFSQNNCVNVDDSSPFSSNQIPDKPNLPDLPNVHVHESDH